MGEEEEDHNLSGSSSCISLENPRLLRSTAVPRHLCTPPLLVPNNNSPPNAFSLNLQQLLQEQQQQLQEQHNQLQKPAATTKFTRRKCSTEDASCSRGIPLLIANPWLHLAAEASQPHVPLQKPVIKWLKRGGQTNGILMTSSTRYEDLSDKEETFVRPLTFPRSPSDQISLPESCHPQIQLNDLQHYQHKKFSKGMIICHMLLSCIFVNVATNFLLDRCEESDS